MERCGTKTRSSAHPRLDKRKTGRWQRTAMGMVPIHEASGKPGSHYQWYGRIKATTKQCSANAALIPVMEALMRMNHKRQSVKVAGYSLIGSSFDLLHKPSVRSPKDAAGDSAKKIIAKVKKARIENKQTDHYA